MLLREKKQKRKCHFEMICCFIPTSSVKKQTKNAECKFSCQAVFVVKFASAQNKTLQNVKVL